VTIDATGGATTGTLPPLAQVRPGDGWLVTHALGANPTTLVPNGAETINGVNAPLPLLLGVSYRVTAGPSGWLVSPEAAPGGLTLPSKLFPQNAGGVVAGIGGGETYDTTGGSFTRTLPDAHGYQDGQSLVFKVTAGTDIVTLAAVAGQTIDGHPTVDVYPNQSLWLVTTGGNWIVAATASVTFQKGVGVLQVDVLDGGGTANYNTLVSDFANAPIQVTNVMAWKDANAGGVGDTGAVVNTAAAVIYGSAGAPISMAATIANGRIVDIASTLNVANGLLNPTDTIGVDIVEASHAGGTWFIEFYCPAP